MSDDLHEIPDDELGRRIQLAELQLDRLYTEKYRRLASTRQSSPTPSWRTFPRQLARRRNDTQQGA